MFSVNLVYLQKRSLRFGISVELDEIHFHLFCKTNLADIVTGSHFGFQDIVFGVAHTPISNLASV